MCRRLNNMNMMIMHERSAHMMAPALNADEMRALNQGKESKKLEVWHYLASAHLKNCFICLLRQCHVLMQCKGT